jgi:NAD(P)-dependent dehydrogenase (short-subunit alcohol dehydrogenase family)
MHVVLAARNPEKGEQAARTLRDGGLEITAEQLDVTDSQSVEDCVRRLAKAGTEIDVLVNNAGVYPTDDVFSVSEESFKMALEVNAIGPFRTCQAFVPGMVQRGYGRVVNVSSGGGVLGCPWRRKGQRHVFGLG